MSNTKRILRGPKGAPAAWALAMMGAMGAMGAIGAIGAMEAHAQTPAHAPSSAPAPAPASPPPGTAAASGQPDATSAAYGDWVLQCQRDSAQAGGPFCELRQTVMAEGQRPIAQLAIARLSAQAPLRFAVVLPTHVSFAEPPRVVAGEAGATGTASAAAEAAVSLVWRRCLPVGCFADGDLAEAVTRQWRSQAPGPAQAQAATGRLVFQDGSGRAVALPVSFRGVGEALDALNRN